MKQFSTRFALFFFACPLLSYPVGCRIGSASKANASTKCFSPTVSHPAPRRTADLAETRSRIRNAFAESPLAGVLSPVTAPLLGARTHSSAHILFLAPLGLWGSARPCRASASQSRRLCLAVPASCSQPSSGVPLALVMRMAFPRPETDFGTPGPSFIGSRSSCPPRPPELRDHSPDRRGRWREGRKPGVESWPAARSGLHGESSNTQGKP